MTRKGDKTMSITEYLWTLVQLRQRMEWSMSHKDTEGGAKWDAYVALRLELRRVSMRH